MATSNLSSYNKEDIPEITDKKFALVVSKWNEDITENLKNGAITTLLENNVSKKNITTFYVPGTFELPFICKKAISSQKYDAIIAIGCVIEGETKHFDYVCQGVTYGIMQLNITHNIPVIFCVLTDQNKQQSIDRSGGKYGNKGIESAITAIQMANL